MKFKTDFLAQDYSELCWFQAKTVSTILSVLIAIALTLTIVGLSQSIIIGAVVLVVAIPVSYILQKRNVINRADRRYGAFGASSELYLEIDDDEIRQSAASGETRLPWEDVYAVCESKNSYYVFLTKRKAFYFPKRSFESEDHKKEFLRYIKENVPEKKIKIKK